MLPRVAAFIFLSIVAAVFGADDVYKSNCFYEDPSDSCRSKTVVISGKLYGCTDAIEFENEIKKIEFLQQANQQTILVQDNKLTSYEIDESDSMKRRSNLVSTESCTLIVDKRDNVFKIEFGQASVVGPKGQRTRNITTESGFIPRELALDPKTGMLVILAVKKNNRGGTDKGSLYAINVENLSRDPVIQAERISPLNVIFTGLSIYEGLDDLLVGIKTDGRYKYVKLSAVPSDNQCFKRQKRSLQEEILTVLEETNLEESERISQLCSEYIQPAISENLLSANRAITRISGSDTSECDEKLERQRKLLQKINTFFKPLITAKPGPNFAKNSKALNDFFNDVHEILLE